MKKINLKKRMDCKCNSIFNSLSKTDRVKLKGAAATKAITGLIRDDTKKRPWRYPFYALYLVVMTTPLPFLGASTVLAAATIAWAKWEITPLAKELNGRIKASFNHAALVHRHKDFLEADPELSGGHKVKGLYLAWDTTKKSASDTWQATKHAWKAMKILS